jgi:hypothetical protein
MVSELISELKAFLDEASKLEFWISIFLVGDCLTTIVKKKKIVTAIDQRSVFDKILQRPVCPQQSINLSIFGSHIR